MGKSHFESETERGDKTEFGYFYSGPQFDVSVGKYGKHRIVKCRFEVCFFRYAPAIRAVLYADKK